MVKGTIDTRIHYGLEMYAFYGYRLDTVTQ